MIVKKQILIIDEVHPILLDQLKDHDLAYHPYISLDELPNSLKTAEVLIVRSKLRITKDWIQQAPKLKIIGRLGSGMDNIDIDFAMSKGISCINAPEGNRNAVAEQTLGMLLGLLSNIDKSAREVRSCSWDRKGNQGLELKNLTVGIIGYGNVGSRLAELLVPFGCKVLAYDKYISGYGSGIAEECDLKKIQKDADIVTCHTPLNKSSYEMINDDFVRAMAKPFFLLNLSRGRVLKVSDVIKGLKDKSILGLALDVLPNEKLNSFSENEKVEFDFLANNKKVIITPHIGGLTKDSFKSLAEVLAEKILKQLDSSNHLLTQTKP